MCVGTAGPERTGPVVRVVHAHLRLDATLADGIVIRVVGSTVHTIAALGKGTLAPGGSPGARR